MSSIQFMKTRLCQIVAKPSIGWISHNEVTAVNPSSVQGWWGEGERLTGLFVSGRVLSVGAETAAGDAQLSNLNFGLSTSFSKIDCSTSDAICCSKAGYLCWFIDSIVLNTKWMIHLFTETIENYRYI